MKPFNNYKVLSHGPNLYGIDYHRSDESSQKESGLYRK